MVVGARAKRRVEVKHNGERFVRWSAGDETDWYAITPNLDLLPHEEKLLERQFMRRDR
jgi:hypothetical protein